MYAMHEICQTSENSVMQYIQNFFNKISAREW